MGEIGSRMASASVILSASQLLAAAVAVVFSIITARLLGPGGYGLVNLALTYPAMLASIVDLGLSTVIARFAAANGAEGLEYVWSGIVFKLLLGLAGSLIVYLYADFFAGLLGRAELAASIRVLSLYVPAMAILGALTSAYMGFGRYALAGSVVVLQNLFRGLLATWLILAGLGVLGAVASFTISYSALALAYFLLSLRLFGEPRLSRSALRVMVSMAAPLYLAAVVGILVPPFVDTLVAREASDVVVGNYKVAMASAAPVTVIASSVSTAALTSLPLLLSDGDSLRDSSGRASLYVSVALSAIMLGYMAVQPWLILLLYGSGFSLATSYANIYVAGFLADAFFGSYIIGNHLIAVGATRWNGIIAVAKTVTVALSAVILVPAQGAMGAVLSYSLGELAGSIITYLVGRRVYDIRLDLGDSLRGLLPPLISFTAASIAAYSIGSRLASFLVALTVFAATYLLLLPLFVDRGIIRGLVDLLGNVAYIGRFMKVLGEAYLGLVQKINHKSA